MESIDDYQKRKEERIEKLFGSNKKQERLNRLAKPKVKFIAKSRIVNLSFSTGNISSDVESPHSNL